MSLKAIAQSYGDPVKAVAFSFNGATANLLVRRLPFIDLDNLRATSLNNDGKFDPAKSAGYRARLIAAAVKDADETNEAGEARSLTEYEVGQWPDDMVTELAKLVQKHNGMDDAAVKEASKNSAPTPAAGG